MWDVVNHTPFAADGSWWRDRNGIHTWLVGVKATYDILPNGSVSLSETQPAPLLAPVYFGEDGLSSLRYDTEIAPPKPTTDILLNATAHAPGGRPSTRFRAGFRLGPVYKVVEIHGIRAWVEGAFGLTVSSAAPVASLPVRYESAYGGYDATDHDPARQALEPRNPVGTGIAADRSRLVGQRVPCISYPGKDFADAIPAGLGAIPDHWSPRRELQGTYDEAWQKSRRPLLAKDWSPESLQAAPADQRPPVHLRGGEPVELSNLHLSGHLSFALPMVELRFTTRIDLREESHSGILSSVIIEPDDARLILIWTTSISCPTDPDFLEETVVHMV
jgi:hypothetical protein